MSNKKLTLDFVKAEFKKEGYILLENIYINNSTRMNYVCPSKHKHSINWNNWKSGSRCPYCAGVVKVSIDNVRKSFEKEGYILLSKEYKNNATKLEYICSSGHKGSIVWHSWNILKHKCRQCYIDKKTTEFEEIKKSFEKEGYTLLDKQYNVKENLNYICNLGHKHNILLGHWNKGVRCPTCFYINNSGPNHHAWQGGISFEPYCEIWKDKEYKESIKERDDHRCLNPYCPTKSKNDLVIHHIDYNKKNCGPDNLITVCRGCNNRANFDRRWHKNWYRAILYRRYNYFY